MFRDERWNFQFVDVKKVESVTVLASSEAVTDETSAVNRLCRWILISSGLSGHINPLIYSVFALTKPTENLTTTKYYTVSWSTIHG